MLRQAALAGIWGYQRFLSPRKGFRCPYSRLNGGTGCSGHAKAAIRDHGVVAALPLIRERLAACKSAARTLSASCPVHAMQVDSQDTGQESPRKRKKSKTEHLDGFCDGYNCVTVCGGPSEFCSPGSLLPGKRGGGKGDGCDCDHGCVPYCSP